MPEEAQCETVKEAVAWQLARAMKRQNLTKRRMAALLRTSRWQLNRILDPEDDITLSTLERAAVLVGRRVTVELKPQQTRKSSRNKFGF